MAQRNQLLTVVVGVGAILIGLAPFLTIGLPRESALLVAGLALLITVGRHQRGILLISIWLIATGILSLVTISIPSSGTILSLLAIAGGLLVLLDR